MAFSCFLSSYRYLFFAITIVSNAIICSAAVWNLPIANNTIFHTQRQVDIYMIFLGAFSLLFVIPMVFIDLFSQQALAGRVWVECLWIDFLWLLHLIGVIFVTAFLPHDMCTPQAKFINGDSCTSAKLILAFSWICTINLSIYLVSLVVSAMLHYRQDCTVWRSQVRSYPWYSELHLCKLASRPNTPPPRPQNPAPISAPQPRRPIQLPARAVLSYLHKVENMHAPPAQKDPGDLPPVRRASQQAMQQATSPSTRLTLLYPLHIQAVWGATGDGPSARANARRDSAAVVASTSQIPHRSALAPPATTLPPDGGPPPLWNWPRADIMTLPPPPSRKKGKGKAVTPASTSRTAPAADAPPPRRSPRSWRRSSARSPPTSMPTSPV